MAGGLCLPGGCMHAWGVHAGGCVAGGVHGRGMCMPGEGVRARGGVHAWGMRGQGAMRAMHAPLPQHHKIQLVNARPVHILLECILVLYCFASICLAPFLSYFTIFHKSNAKIFQSENNDQNYLFTEGYI